MTSPALRLDAAAEVLCQKRHPDSSRRFCTECEGWMEEVASVFEVVISDLDAARERAAMWAGEGLGQEPPTLQQSPPVLDSIRELHAERRVDLDGFSIHKCRECGWNYPCPTIIVLEGKPS